MTETERKALAQAVQAAGRRMQDYNIMAKENVLRQSIEAHARTIEQHEAFRQEVSGAVEAVFAGYHDAPIPWVVMRRKLEPFIIAKPDPLVEAWDEAWRELSNKPTKLETFRAALAARGLEIREMGQ